MKQIVQCPRDSVNFMQEYGEIVQLPTDEELIEIYESGYKDGNEVCYRMPSLTYKQSFLGNLGPEKFTNFLNIIWNISNKMKQQGLRE